MTSKEQRGARLDEVFRQRAALDGEIVVLLGEADRAEDYEEDGATSTEAWVAERFGVTRSTARSLTHVGRKAADIPHLVGALRAGEVSLDKVRAVADVATAKNDQHLCNEARRHSLRELADIARSIEKASASSARSEHDRRYVRFNDQCRTVTAQLPTESYAEAKACLEGRARQVPSDGETPWDQRLCDAFTEIMGGGSAGSSFVVVAHVPLDALLEDSDLAGELEHDGLIDNETVRRVACDATVAVAVDDDVGHTMYEGRATRFPTDAQRREVTRRDRQCRFPGCPNLTFTNVHHIVPWKPGGTTDLDNLALMCRHHHGVVHRKGWAMSGNANGELTFLGPSGRVMTSRPSPLWARIASPSPQS
jgi:hypothetical protein